MLRETPGERENRADLPSFRRPRERKKSDGSPICWRQNQPSVVSAAVLRAHAPRVMAVDVEAARRLAPGKKERAKPTKPKRGLGKTEGDVPAEKEKPARSFSKASRSFSAEPKHTPQRPARGGGKPPRAPREAKKGVVQDAGARRASTQPSGTFGLSPNELVAGLAGSLAMCVVSGVSKLVRRKFSPGGRAATGSEKAQRKDLSAEERAKLDAVKAELRDALAQLREQRKSMDHLRKQNKEMARENQLLKVAAANAAAASRRDNIASRSGSPSGPLSTRASPECSAPASPEPDAEASAVGVVSEPASGGPSAIVARLLHPPLEANADEAARASRALAARVLCGVLGIRPSPSARDEAFSRRDNDEAREDESATVFGLARGGASRALEPPERPTHASIGDAFASQEDAWAGVPRGSPGAGSEYDDARSARSAASGFSGISDLSTLSAAEALLSRMRARHVLMARIKNHR